MHNFAIMEIKWFRHFWFWMVYLAFEGYTEFEWIVRQYHLTIANGLATAFASETLQVLVIKIPMVYLLFRMMELYYKQKLSKLNTIGFMCTILLVFTLLSRILVTEVLLPEIYNQPKLLPVFDFLGMMDSFMNKIFIAGVAIALKQYSVSRQLQDRERLLVKEKLETELNFLKSQVNPHFLFNTLNNMYALARKKSDQTADVVIKLSKLLRFVLYETQHRSIPLSKEIHFLEDYIELEKIRYGDRLRIQFVCEADDQNIGIVPLILVPFVENAFKHGASETVEQAQISIQLKLQNKKLSFVVRNTFEKDAADAIEDGIGLKNLRRQLELSYQSFDLDAAADGNDFTARLSIDLNELP